MLPIPYLKEATWFVQCCKILGTLQLEVYDTTDIGKKLCNHGSVVGEIHPILAEPIVTTPRQRVHRKLHSAKTQRHYHDPNKNYGTGKWVGGVVNQTDNFPNMVFNLFLKKKLKMEGRCFQQKTTRVALLSVSVFWLVVFCCQIYPMCLATVEQWKNVPWLFRVFRGWNTTQLYGDYKKLI